MKQSQFYYLLRRGLFSAGSAIIKNGLVMFNKFTTAGISHPAQGSAEFNGSSDYIQLDTPFSHTNHTIAAWCYVEDGDSQSTILDTRDANDDGVLFVFGTLETIRYELNTSDVSYAEILSNDWHFVTATYDGTTQKLYVDGSLVDSATTSQTLDTTTNWVIGKRSFSTGANFFYGNLAKHHFRHKRRK